MVCGHSLCNFVPHKLLKEQVAEYVSCFALAGSPTPSYLLVLVVTILLAFADRSAVDEHLGGNPPPHPHPSVINRKRFLWTLNTNRKKRGQKLLLMLVLFLYVRKGLYGIFVERRKEKRKKRRKKKMTASILERLCYFVPSIMSHVRC